MSTFLTRNEVLVSVAKTVAFWFMLGAAVVMGVPL